MHEDDSSEFSDDGLDEFEESMEDRNKKPPLKNQTAYSNKPYDEAYELSQDLSMAESFDGREKVIASGKFSILYYHFAYIIRFKMKKREN